MGRTLMQALALSVLQMRNRNHEFMVLEHLLLAISYERTGKRILEGCNININLLREDLEEYLTDNIPVNQNKPTEEIYQTPAVTRVIERTMQHTKHAGRSQAEVGDILASFFEEEDCWASYFLTKQGLSRLQVLEFISHEKPSADVGTGEHIIISDITQIASPEDVEAITDAIRKGQRQQNEHREQREQRERQEQGDGEPKNALAHYTIDLVEKARKGRIDPLIGRNTELHRTLEILSRRRKNNPLLIGEPGTGKTAIAEGLALAIAEQNVPEPFLQTRVHALDLGALLAGARYRGDFESRIKAVVKELKEQPNSILVIDEIHTIVGAGATSGGSLDASNLLKPILASGELRCIGSTTYEEFRTHFEKDRALARRFQRIDIREPSKEDCLKILEGLQKYYEGFHNVRFTKEALEATVDYSVRYLQDRLLPDKAIDILDESAASVRLSPEVIEKTKRNIREINNDETAVLIDETEANGKKTRRKRKYIPTVNVYDIEKTVARMAGVPVTNITNSEKNRLRSLKTDLLNRIFGQEPAVETVTNAIWRARAGLGRENRPQASFLFHGPTGVGKTELAKSLADLLNVPFLRFDMSEYMEKHAVARLIGSPPGYVGFEQGGLLTEAIRKNPYAVLLLDEVEKAHPDIFNVLLQVMDYATLTDNNGKKADFRHTIIIMTTNAGAREMEQSPMGFVDKDSGQSSKRSLKAIEQNFSPEFRNRLDAMIGFSNLGPEQMLPIVDKAIKELFVGLEARGVDLELAATARNWLASRGFDAKLGARPLQRLIRTELEDRLAQEVLFGKLSKGGQVKVIATSPNIEHLEFSFEDNKDLQEIDKTKEANKLSKPRNTRKTTKPKKLADIA